MKLISPLPAGLNRWHPAVWLATWFGCGQSRFAPGTVGSLAALPVAWILYSLFGQTAVMVAAIVISAIGVWAAGYFVRNSVAEESSETNLGEHDPARHEPDRHDPGMIVIDEVAGQLTALALLPSALIWPANNDITDSMICYGAAFILFRVLDITKPGPIMWCERRWSGGFGVVVDDIVAGIITGLVISAAARLIF